MAKAANFQTAVSTLKTILAKAQNDTALTASTQARDEVLTRYQSTFDINKLPSLSEEEFRQFLHFKNNRHWISLQRMGPAICSDMNRLRQALTILLNEDRPIRERLNELVPVTGPAFVPRLSKAVLTPILLICHPGQYGVWNQISEGAMKTLEIWPNFQRGEPFGDRYVKVNGILNELAQDVGVDLWTLDVLMWRVESPFEISNDETQLPVDVVGSLQDGESSAAQTFGLERHLQDFLRDNWAHTELGKNWDLYEEDGDPEAGYEYPCSVGRIDLLAKHQREPRWLVIELKLSVQGSRS